MCPKCNVAVAWHLEKCPSCNTITKNEFIFTNSLSTEEMEESEEIQIERKSNRISGERNASDTSLGELEDAQSRYNFMVWAPARKFNLGFTILIIALSLLLLSRCSTSGDNQASEFADESNSITLYTFLRSLPNWDAAEICFANPTPLSEKDSSAVDTSMKPVEKLMASHDTFHPEEEIVFGDEFSDIFKNGTKMTGQKFEWQIVVYAYCQNKMKQNDFSEVFKERSAELKKEAVQQEKEEREYKKRISRFVSVYPSLNNKAVKAGFNSITDYIKTRNSTGYTLKQGAQLNLTGQEQSVESANCYGTSFSRSFNGNPTGWWYCYMHTLGGTNDFWSIEFKSDGSWSGIPDRGSRAGSDLNIEEKMPAGFEDWLLETYPN